MGPCPSCAAPFGAGTPLVDDRRLRQHAGPRPDDWPELRFAFQAWRAGDVHQMVGVCLQALGFSGTSFVERNGCQYWPAVPRTGVLFLFSDPRRSLVGVESPIVRLPARLAVPALRFLLSTNGQLNGHARYVLRDHVVVLRFAKRLEGCSPPELVQAVREVAARSERMTDLMSATFFAEPIAPEVRKTGLDPVCLGIPRELRMLSAAGDAAAPAAPTVSSARFAPPSSSPPPPSSRPAAPASAQPPAPRAASSPAMPVTAHGGGRSAIIEETQQRLAFAERFAALMEETLRRGQTHQEHVALVGLVQRAAIFRAHHEFASALPKAVAVLFGVGRSLVEQPPKLRARGFFGRGDVPNPSLLAPTFARLARDLGDVTGSPPSATPPRFASAAILKAHLRELMEDLESMPIDPSTKSFVLLGAVAESMLRAAMTPAIAEQLATTYAAATNEPPLRAVAMLRPALARLAS